MSEGATSAAAHQWAHSQVTLHALQRLLSNPLADDRVVDAFLPSGGLRDMHLVQLALLASSLSSHFEIDHGNAGYAMHVWLYHLLDGKQRGLTGPTADKRASESRWVGTHCER